MNNESKLITSPSSDNSNYAQNNQQSTFFMNPMIDSLSGWMKFVSIYTIVLGSITCLGIVTAAIGVPLILAGISLNKGAKNITTYKNCNNPYILNEVFASINSYFKIKGILTIINISLTLIYLVFFLIFVVLSVNNSYTYYPY